MVSLKKMKILYRLKNTRMENGIQSIKKRICLDSYFLFTKGKQFGLIEYETDYCTYFQLKYNFNNVIKCINSNNELELIHLNDANEKYICFCSNLSRASVIVFNIDELEDFVDELILE